MKDWFLPAISIPIIWGLWGLFPKLAVRYISIPSAMLFEIVGVVIFGIFFLIFVGFRPEIHPIGVAFAFFAGVFGSLGAFLYLIAVSRGKVSVIVFISALYPVVTIALAYILLREPITIKEGIGMALACIAIILFSS